MNYTKTCLFTATSGVATSPVTYEWFGPNGRLLSTSRSLILNHINESNAGEYSCRVTVGTEDNEVVGCDVEQFILRGELWLMKCKI